MTEDNERYVDPNSGAAPQPGGFTAAPVETGNKSNEAEPATDPVYDAEVEHSAGPAGEQPANEDGVNAGEDGQSAESGGEEKDYSELLDGTIEDVQDYLEKHPEEKDAVVKAEEAGKNRKGIVEA